jgi:hypothetical protein
MVACSRARASWRAIVSRPELTLASWAIRLARSGCVGGVAGAWSATLDPASAAWCRRCRRSGRRRGGGPGERLWRSGRLASSAKLLSVIEPFVPLLLLDEYFVIAPEHGNGCGPRRGIVVESRPAAVRCPSDGLVASSSDGDHQGLRTPVVFRPRGLARQASGGQLKGCSRQGINGCLCQRSGKPSASSYRSAARASSPRLRAMAPSIFRTCAIPHASAMARQAASASSIASSASGRWPAAATAPRSRVRRPRHPRPPRTEANSRPLPPARRAAHAA